MKKILITGGKGFIARNLSEMLGTEYEIFSPGSEDLNLLDEERVLEYLKRNKFDVVIHAATYDAAPKDSPKDPTKVLENNLKMFFNIVRGKNYFGKMIYFGSGAEYSREHWLPKMKESYFDQHVPSDQYGFSKYVMTKFAQLENNIYNLRLFGVFGKYEDWRYRFISNTCCKVLLDLPITIKQNKIFDFLYVDDLIRIVKWFIERDPLHRVYNVCAGKGYEFRSIAEKVLEVAEKKLDIVIAEERISIEYSGDNSLLLKELGDFEFTPIEEAIKSLYHWYEANKDIIKKEEFHY